MIDARHGAPRARQPAPCPHRSRPPGPPAATRTAPPPATEPPRRRRPPPPPPEAVAPPAAPRAAAPAAEPAGPAASPVPVPPGRCAHQPGGGLVIRPAAGDRVIPFSNMRRRTAEHMVRSKATSPHAFIAYEVDFENVERVRRAWGARFRAEEGFSLTYLPFVARATVEALRDHPDLNASVGEDSLVVHQQVNLGIAVDLDHEGLIVPVVHRAEEVTLRGMARRIRDLADRARTRQLDGRRHRRRDLLDHQRRAVRHLLHRADHQPAPGGHLGHRRDHAPPGGGRPSPTAPSRSPSTRSGCSG